jgi:hypothetical protein
MPRRPPSDQVLLPWTVADVKRLKLAATPELVAAIEKTWNGIGGEA